MGDDPAGIRVPDADMDTHHLRPDAFHGEWNYALLPRQRLPKECDGLFRGSP